MRRIELTKGLSTLIADEDYKEVSKYSWYAHKGRHTFYAARRGAGKVFIYLHRFLLSAQPNELVDHVNGDGLDNRRQNLRTCSMSQNSGNQHRLRTDNTSGYRGVHQDKRDGSWIAQIRGGGKVRHLGTFKNAKDAAKAYNEAALRQYGEFAKLNDIQEECYAS